MAIRFQPAKIPHGDAPNVQNYDPGSDQTFERGSPVTYDSASDELDEHAGGATVTDILGVSLEGCESGVADSPSGQVAVAKASGDKEFVGQVISGGSVVTDLSTVSIGDEYGMLENNDEWFVDFDDTTDVVVAITQIDDDLDIVWFKFLDSAVQDL